MIEVKKKRIKHACTCSFKNTNWKKSNKPNKTNKMTVHSFYFYKNIFYKNIEADISLILRLL